MPISVMRISTKKETVFDMVYFQSKAVYKAGDTFIIVTHIDKSKDRLTYRYIHGHVRHSAPIYWSRVRNQEHPVQYINVKGLRVWAYEV